MVPYMTSFVLFRIIGAAGHNFFRHEGTQLSPYYMSWPISGAGCTTGGFVALGFLIVRVLDIRFDVPFN